MAWEQVPEMFEWAQNAGADLTGKLHYIAKVDTDGDIVLAAAATEAILGVIREENVENKPVTVQFGGIGKVICGASVTAGQNLTSDGNGKATPASAGNQILGRALMNGDSGDIISVAITLATG